MANEIVAAERWLRAVLIADATLQTLVGTRVRGHTVPPGMAYPLVFYTMPGAGDDTTTLEGYRVYSQLVYAVRYIKRSETFAELEEGADAIETALHRASGSNVSGVILACVRQAPFHLIELANDGTELRQLGAIYRLYVQ